MDDDVRERHGVTATTEYVGTKGYASAVETDQSVKIITSDGSKVVATLITPASARRLASQLNRLARRIEQRNQ